MTVCPDILAVVPARGGSKGVPHKHERILNGKPLIAHVTCAARAARTRMDLILSTDDRRIAAIADDIGLSVPFIRPADLAADDTPSSEVALHALRTMEMHRDKPYDLFVLLQPTCPFTRSATIDRVVDTLLSGYFDFVGTAFEVIDHHPAYLLSLEDKGRLVPAFPDLYTTRRRQDLMLMFARSGNVYAVRRDSLVTTGTLIQPNSTYVLVDRTEAININTYFDWLLAEVASLNGEF